MRKSGLHKKPVIVGNEKRFSGTIFDVFNVARNFYKVDILPDCLSRIGEVNELYMRLRREQIIYGDSTGFGERVGHYVSPDHDKEKNKNLVYMLNCGSGPCLREDQVRAAIFVRILVLSKACSGVRPLLVARLADMLNENKIPKVPSLGSIGASGDLIPSSYVALEILKEIDLEGREGLALLNGTHFMSGISALVLMDFSYLLQTICGFLAILFQCLGGIENIFNADLHAIKSHKAQTEIAGSFREYLLGSNLLRNIDELHNLDINELKKLKPIQDRYSLRCLPQNLGSIFHRLNDAFGSVENELNSVSDNPVIVNGEIKHGGHFDGSFIADAMDCLKLSIRKTAYVVRAYIRNTTDAKLNRGLFPTYMISNDNGLNNGFQGLTGLSVDAVFAALTKECIADSIFSMNDHECINQDVVSFGMHSALSASRAVSQLGTMTSILAIVTRQAVELMNAESKLSPWTKNIYNNLRCHIHFTDSDRSLHSQLKLLERLFFEHKF